VLAEERVIGPGVERKRNAIALGIAAVAILALAGFLYRPAIVIRVHGDALAHSVGGDDVLGRSSCTEQQGGIWQCHISRSSGAITYNVRTHGSFGCWDATRADQNRKPRRGNGASGCINGLDVFSPF
jgi:hypothetical protein